MYIKFNTISDFNDWHSQVKSNLGLTDKDYTKPINHPNDGTVICGFNNLVNVSNLNVITNSQAILSGYVNGDVNKSLRDLVNDSINFGQELLVDYAAENVALGITQAGKTKEVADYLSDLMRYAQTGSLYEVINEVDRLIAAGLPADLEPFITLNKMNEFKQKVIDYLT